jgi:hypothetical protein
MELLVRGVELQGVQELRALMEIPDPRDRQAPKDYRGQWVLKACKEYKDLPARKVFREYKVMQVLPVLQDLPEQQEIMEVRE